MLGPAESRRVALSLVHPVQITTALHSGTGMILNLSQGGAYVNTSMSILPFAHAFIHLPFPEKHKYVRLEAVAVWENRGKNLVNELERGYGFRFVKISEKAEMAIQSLMEPERLKDKTMGLRHARKSGKNPLEAPDSLSAIMLGLGNSTRLGSSER